MESLTNFQNQSTIREMGDKNNIAALRKRLGMNQGDLAAAIGKSDAYISMIESGKRIGRLDVVRRIAAALQCSVEDLGIAASDPPLIEGLRFVPPPVYRIPVQARLTTGNADEVVVMDADPFGWEPAIEEPSGKELMVELSVDVGDRFRAGDRLKFVQGEPPVSGDVVIATFAPPGGELVRTAKVYRIAPSGAIILEPLDRARYRDAPLDDRWTIEAVMVEHVQRQVRGRY